MKRLTLALFLLYSYGFLMCDNVVKPLPENFYKRFEGSLDGKYKIVMNMTRRASQLTGSYYYVKFGQPISFSWGSQINNEGYFVIEEESSAYEENSRNIFKGRFVNENRIEGYWKKSSSNDSLKFELEEKYTSGSVKAGMKYLHKEMDSLVTISFEFPDFKTVIIKDSLNKFINKFLLGKENQPSINTAAFGEAMQDYIERYTQEVLIDTIFGDYQPPYFSESSLRIFFNSDNIISLEGFGYAFEGGAHGNYYYDYNNFDIRTGKRITYKDIFVDNYIDELNKTGEKIFKEFFKEDPDQSLAKQGWFGFDDGFFVNDNFVICEGGLLIRYNPYEAGAYALGAPSIFIPYKEIKNIIKADGLIGRLIN